MIKAINPDAIKEVNIDGDFKVEIGIIPYGKRVEIESAAFFNKDAKTKEEVLAIMEQSYHFVQWGIKGHTNFFYQDGSPVPFASKKEKFNEIEYTIVDEKTMDIYAATGLLPELSKAVSDFNYQKAEVVKN